MAATSDQLRRDIEDTRAELSREIDELADRTLPNRIVKRRWPVLRERAKLVAEEIMGTPGLVTQAVTDGDEPDGDDGAARLRAGYPLTAGVIAFGAGLALALIIPARKAPLSEPPAD
ncbi:MAG: DUF3618 domain-containing protein [Stackebrandtia sp.]